MNISNRVWWAAVGVVAALSACAGNDEAEEADDAAASGAGGTGGTVSLSGSSGGGSAGLAGALSLPACTEADDQPGVSLGVTQELETTGTVSAVDSEHVAITTPGGTVEINWRGPALDEVLAAGTEVTLSAYDAWGRAFGSELWTIVRTSSATVATLSASPWTILDMTPGAKSAMETPAGFPTLEYSNQGCCSEDSGCCGQRIRCSYADLDASVDDEKVSIELSATETVGAWQVTHLQSLYTASTESVWSVQATFVGPATDAP